MSSTTTTTTKGGRGKPKATKSVSRSQKAGLQFLVGQVAWFLKIDRFAQHVGFGFHVYLFTVLKHLHRRLRHLHHHHRLFNLFTRNLPISSPKTWYPNRKIFSNPSQSSPLHFHKETSKIFKLQNQNKNLP